MKANTEVRLLTKPLAWYMVNSILNKEVITKSLEEMGFNSEANNLSVRRKT